jgi:hypothetical protein
LRWYSFGNSAHKARTASRMSWYLSLLVVMGVARLAAGDVWSLATRPGAICQSESKPSEIQKARPILR